MNILAIETSCDETSAAIVRDGRHVLANVIASQIDIHQKYGGVVPEVASRQHILYITPVLNETLETAGLDWNEIDAIAVTNGPGLAGALLVGVNAAKGLAFARQKPLIGVNHLESHIYANWLIPSQAEDSPPPEFPLVCLVVSGGHTELVLIEGHGDYRMLGKTQDDAAGEAFDKVARVMGLGYPGGPLLEQAAYGGNPQRFPFTRAWLKGTYDFSFSGLKTAVLRKVEEYQAAPPKVAPFSG
ncbi:MAG: tRNA (adenosine(37)-N6)-threonylcarbamoyltransferase complex transferase subunit TsaD, partial [Chloroflexota bacterium]